MFFTDQESGIRSFGREEESAGHAEENILGDEFGTKL